MKLDGTIFAEWFTLCASTEEFLSNYNRLTGHRISFTPPARLIDDATGYFAMPKNDPRQLAHFMAFCMDMRTRIPEDTSASPTSGTTGPMPHASTTVTKLKPEASSGAGRSFAATVLASY